MHLSMSHGAGLQSARTFCSGSANARLFENMITNAPLALRAFGKEFFDHGHVHAKGPSYTFATAMKVQRYGLSNAFNKGGLGLASLCMKDAADVPEFEGSPDLIKDMELFFPICTSFSCLGPHQDVVTVLTLALDPPLDFLAKQEPIKSVKALTMNERLLNDSVRSTLCEIRAKYKQHYGCISLVEATLRLHKMWPENLDVSHLEFPVGLSTSSAVLRVDLSGWRQCDVELALSDILFYVQRTYAGASYVPWHLTEVTS